MLIKDWMNKTIVRIDSNASIQEAISLMEKYDISILPVFEDQTLSGIVAETDLKLISKFIKAKGMHRKDKNIYSRTTIKEIMSDENITIPDNYTIAEAAETFLNCRITGALVTGTNKELVGLITQTDILGAIIRFMGGGKNRVLLAVELVNNRGCIKEITDLVRSLGCRVNSIVTSLSRAQSGYIRVYLMIYNIDVPKFDYLKQLLKEQKRLLYIVDLKEKTRKLS